MDWLGVAGQLVTIAAGFGGLVTGGVSLRITLAERRERQRALARQGDEARARRQAVRVSITADTLRRPLYNFTATNQSSQPIRIVAIEGVIHAEDGREWNIRFFDTTEYPPLYGGISGGHVVPWWGESTPFILAPGQSKTASVTQRELASGYIDSLPYPDNVELKATYIADDETPYQGESGLLSLAYPGRDLPPAEAGQSS